MLRSNQRTILYFDMVMAPHPADAPQMPLMEFLPHLERRCNDGLTFQSIDSDRRLVRLTEIQRVKTSSGAPGVGMLFCLGDREKADPGFTHLVTGKVRIARRQTGEAGGLSVHAVIGLAPTKAGGHIYRMVYEDVNGFGRSVIQAFLRHELKAISDEQGVSFERESGNLVKARPMVEIAGHASEKLKNSLRKGRLLNIELVDYIEADFGFDEEVYIKSARRDMRLGIANDLPKGEGLTLVEKVKVYAQQQGYEKMRVRWKDADLEKPQSAQIDTDKQDAGEALFVKSAEVSLKLPLPDISARMSEELISKMQDLLE
jgi:hypothetical protein